MKIDVIGAGSARIGGATAKVVVGLVVAAGLAVAGGVTWSNVRGNEASAAGPRDLHTAATESFDVAVMANGELEARRQTTLRSGVDRSVTITFLVDEGKRVEEGELLVELSAEEIEQRVEDSQLQVEQAENTHISKKNSYDIQMKDNEASLRKAQLNLELKEIELNKWSEGELKKRRSELKLAIEKAERNQKRWADKYEQSVRLFESQFLSQDELRQDEISKLEADAQVETAELNKWMFETYEIEQTFKQRRSDVAEATAEIEKVAQQNENRLASAYADMLSAERQLGIRQERLKDALEQLDSTKIFAPTDGLVVYATSTSKHKGRSFQTGDGGLAIGRTVREREELIILPDTSEMVASVRVHESIIGTVNEGQRAMVRVDAIDGEMFNGRVLNKSILADSSNWRNPSQREYIVKVLLDTENRDQRLKPSMMAQTEVFTGRAEEVIAVPAQSVFYDDSVAFVYVLADAGRFERRPIMIGARSDLRVEVQKGLSEGEQVLMRQPTLAEVIPGEFDEAVVAEFGVQKDVVVEDAAALPNTAAVGERGNRRGGALNFDPAQLIDGLISRLPADASPEMKADIEALRGMDTQAALAKYRELQQKHPELQRQRGGGGERPQRRRGGEGGDEGGGRPDGSVGDDE